MRSSKRAIALLFVGLSGVLAVAQSRPHPALGAAQELFRQAEVLLRQGQVSQAYQKAIAGLRLDPTSARGNNLLGLIYEQGKQYAQASAAFEKALQRAPGSAKILTNLGNSFLIERRFHHAESEFRAALAADPASRSANYNLGVTLLAERQPQQAIGYFQAVRPPDLSSRFNLTQAYLQAGEAAKGLAEAAKLSKLAKNDVRVHFSLGVLLAANHQEAAGARELEIADALEPGTFEILYNLGQDYLDQGETKKAERTLNEALKLRPHSAATVYLLARALADQRQDVKALEWLVKAHQWAPQNTDVIFLMARLSMKMAYYEDAIPLLKSGLKIAPERPDLHAALGECYFISGQIQKAIQQFQLLIQLSPRASSYAFMGLCYRHLGQFQKAKEYLEQGLKADPRNAACLYNMGYILSREGHYHQAEVWLKKALDTDPHYVGAMLELAGVEMELGKNAEAIPLLRRCAHLDPRPAPVYYKLATAERNLHQMAAAEQDLKVFETLSRDPTPGPYPYQHLFDYLDQREGLGASERSELDLAQLQREVQLHPGRPRDWYLLAETELRLGRAHAAQLAIAQLDRISHGDFRTAVGVGVLLARYGLYPQAIAHFETAVKANPQSNDAWYDLANAYFRAGDDSDALDATERVSPAGQRDPSFLSLRGDIEMHLGQAEAAIHDYQQVIEQDPDRDRNYLSLALAYLSLGNLSEADQVLHQGLARAPDSGVLFWGLGVLAVAEGHPQMAEEDFKKSVDLLPLWPPTYSALGMLYYDTGQIAKARELLQQFTQNGPRGALNVQRIEQALAGASQNQTGRVQPATLSPEAQRQFLTVALALGEQAP